MKATSLESAFLPVTTDIAPLRKMLRRGKAMAEVRHAIGEADFKTTYDFLRAEAIEMVGRGEIDLAIEGITQIDSLISRSGDTEPHLLDVHAALLQILTALLIEKDSIDEALQVAASTLTLLSQEAKRKDEPFLSILGALLYDIAYLHAARGEYRQAERELGKSLKIFERLAKTDPGRYAPPHLMAMSTATAVYRRRVRQAELLAHYQAATSTYLQMVGAGIAEASDRLAESLTREGDTLAQMGRHREAVQYYTRALKTITRTETEFSLRQLRLSIALGESMLRIGAMKDKGVHLLNTMLHKATKIGALDEHRRIVDILVDARTSKLDILGLWHKIFPK